MATSICASAGCRVLSSWVAEHGRQRDSARQRGAHPDERANDLVRHRGHNRDEHDLTDEPHRGGEQSERREDADAHQRHHDEKPGPAARMEAAASTHVRNVDRIAGLERVDRHVLGAVILKEPAHIGNQPDQQQVARPGSRRESRPR